MTEEDLITVTSENGEEYAVVDPKAQSTNQPSNPLRSDKYTIESFTPRSQPIVRFHQSEVRMKGSQDLVIHLVIRRTE